MTKTEILKLVGDIKSDSKSISKNAEKELIKICEPIIKKYYNIAREYGNTEVCGWEEDYVSSRGELTEFIGYENGVLTFYYEDGCRGNHYECEVKMPLAWLDDSHIKEYRKFCKAKNLVLLEEAIKKAQLEFDKLKERQKELKKK